MGLEPTSGGTTIHCLNLLATLAIPFLNIAFSWLVDLLLGGGKLRNVGLIGGGDSVDLTKIMNFSTRSPKLS